MTEAKCEPEFKVTAPLKVITADGVEFIVAPAVADKMTTLRDIARDSGGEDASPLAIPERYVDQAISYALGEHVPASPELLRAADYLDYAALASFCADAMAGAQYMLRGPQNLDDVATLKAVAMHTTLAHEARRIWSLFDKCIYTADMLPEGKDRNAASQRMADDIALHWRRTDANGVTMFGDVPHSYNAPSFRDDAFEFWHCCGSLHRSAAPAFKTMSPGVEEYWENGVHVRTLMLGLAVMDGAASLAAAAWAEAMKNKQAKRKLEDDEKEDGEEEEYDEE